MPRTITVKGIGRVSTSPDLVVISMSLETTEHDYEATMEFAAQKIEYLNVALEKIGFEKKSVKTTYFNINTNYRSVRDANGNYSHVFDGYVCNHRLKVEFDFDTKRLSQVLSAISKCVAQPEISISFTVKDPSAVSRELLISATANAKEKAEILCEASGVTLGALLSIDYNWGELNVVSHTKFSFDEEMDMACERAIDMEIEPEDIKVNDTATFIWEIN
jgi:uncharacterized protein YggE